MVEALFKPEVLKIIYAKNTTYGVAKDTVFQ